jgi:hypothetical protein
MIDPSQDDIGRAVIYTGNRYPGGKTEEGVITSFNNTAVFVRYGADKHSKGTARADLEWASTAMTRLQISENPPTAAHRRCIIEATIDPLHPFPRGFARSKTGPFFELRTVHALIKIGALRIVKPQRGRHRLIVSARAA